MSTDERGRYRTMTRKLRVARMALAAALLLAGAPPALAAPAAATAASAAAAAALPSCRNADFATLYGQKRSIAHRSLLPTTHLIGAGSQTQVVLSNPAVKTTVVPSDLHFHTFFLDKVKDVDIKPEDAVIGYTRLVADSLSGDQKPIADKLQINQTGNYLLQVDVPGTVSKTFWPQDKRLVVFACTPDGAILWADTDFTLTSQSLPIGVGVFVVLALYLFCVTVVYYRRKKLAAATDEQSAKTTMYRFNELRPWSWFRCLDPVALSSDVFDRGSLANLQILFFSLLVSYGLIFIVMRTGELSSISSTVVALLGISALGSLSAKVAGTSRDRLSAENWSWLVSHKVLPLNDSGKGTPGWSDLVMSDSELDLYKLQALTFSVIVGLGLIVGGFSLATFSVPNELLEVLGLSQAVFVGGRLAKPASMGDLDDLLSELRKREKALRQAATTGIDVDSNGEPKGSPSPNFKTRFKTIEEADASNAIPNAVQRYNETFVQVKVMLEAIAHRDVITDELRDPLQ